MEVVDTENGSALTASLKKIMQREIQLNVLSKRLLSDSNHYTKRTGEVNYDY